MIRKQRGVVSVQMLQLLALLLCQLLVGSSSSSSSTHSGTAAQGGWWSNGVSFLENYVISLLVLVDSVVLSALLLGYVYNRFDKGYSFHLVQFLKQSAAPHVWQSTARLASTVSYKSIYCFYLLLLMLLDINDRLLQKSAMLTAVDLLTIAALVLAEMLQVDFGYYDQLDVYFTISMLTLAIPIIIAQLIIVQSTIIAVQWLYPLVASSRPKEEQKAAVEEDIVTNTSSNKFVEDAIDYISPDNLQITEISEVSTVEINHFEEDKDAVGLDLSQLEDTFQQVVNAEDIDNQSIEIPPPSIVEAEVHHVISSSKKQLKRIPSFSLKFLGSEVDEEVHEIVEALNEIVDPNQEEASIHSKIEGEPVSVQNEDFLDILEVTSEHKFDGDLKESLSLPANVDDLPTYYMQSCLESLDIADYQEDLESSITSILKSSQSRHDGELIVVEESESDTEYDDEILSSFLSTSFIMFDTHTSAQSTKLDDEDSHSSYSFRQNPSNTRSVYPQEDLALEAESICLEPMYEATKESDETEEVHSSIDPLVQENVIGKEDYHTSPIEESDTGKTLQFSFLPYLYN